MSQMFINEIMMEAEGNKIVFTELMQNTNQFSSVRALMSPLVNYQANDCDAFKYFP
jgi:hypothetical protein